MEMENTTMTRLALLLLCLPSSAAKLSRHLTVVYELLIVCPEAPMMRRRSPPSLPKTPAGAAEPSGSAKKRPKSTPPPDQPMLRPVTLKSDHRLSRLARAARW